MQIQIVDIPSLSFSTVTGIPGTPPAGQIRLYIDPDTLLFSFIDHSGTTGTVAGDIPTLVSLTLTEGSTPATPDAGSQTVFIDIGDHHIKRINSAAAVTDLEGISSATPQPTATSGTSGTAVLPAADDHVHQLGSHDHATTTGHGGHIPASSVTGLPAVSSATPQATTTAGAAGVGTDVSADDHAHQLGAHDHATTSGHGGHIPASSVTGLPAISSATPQATTTAGAAGTGTAVSADDHAHQLGAHDHATTTGHGGHIPAASVTGLAAVATSGAYADLTGAPTGTIRIQHTWSLPGPVAVPSGSTNYISGFYVPVPAGQVVHLVEAHAILNTGTTETVTAKLQINGVDATGFTGIGVSTTRVDTAPTAIALANLDLLALVVTAVSGVPKNMTFTVFLDYQGA